MDELAATKHQTCSSLPSTHVLVHDDNQLMSGLVANQSQPKRQDNWQDSTRKQQGSAVQNNANRAPRKQNNGMYLHHHDDHHGSVESEKARKQRDDMGTLKETTLSSTSSSITTTTTTTEQQQQQQQQHDSNPLNIMMHQHDMLYDQSTLKEKQQQHMEKAVQQHMGQASTARKTSPLCLPHMPHQQHILIGGGHPPSMLNRPPQQQQQNPQQPPVSNVIPTNPHQPHVHPLSRHQPTGPIAPFRSTLADIQKFYIPMETQEYRPQIALPMPMQIPYHHQQAFMMYPQQQQHHQHYLPHQHNTRAQPAVKESGRTSPKKEGIRRGVWTAKEHKMFLEGLEMYGKGRWKEISTLISTRDRIQVASHAQKYYEKLQREGQEASNQAHY